jgi:hypothetical protein
MRQSRPNSYPVYQAPHQHISGLLPPARLEIKQGVETSRNHQRSNDGLFANRVRHYDMVARHVSSPAVTLTPRIDAELREALCLACGDDALNVHEGIPSLTKGTSFQVSRPADLFLEGSAQTLAPGTYTAGDTVVDKEKGRVFLEFVGERGTVVGLIGLFMPGRLPTCIDWRVLQAGK